MKNNMKKKVCVYVYMYVYMTESLCCAVEINTTLHCKSLYFNKVNFKKRCSMKNFLWVDSSVSRQWFHKPMHVIKFHRPIYTKGNK